MLVFGVRGSRIVVVVAAGLTRRRRVGGPVHRHRPATSGPHSALRRASAAAATVSKFVHFQLARVYSRQLVPRERRLNCDQVPLNVDHQSKKTFVHHDSANTDEIRISSTNAAATKRFCTLQALAMMIIMIVVVMVMMMMMIM